MSVVHVALLKEVLDKGSDGVKYFTASITLIIISLVLQVMTGLMALLVSHLRSYYAKYKDDLIEDMFENLCCCRIVSNRGRTSRKLARARHTDYALDMTDGNLSSGDEEPMKDGQLDLDNSPQSRITGCCCTCTRKGVLSNYEYDVLEMYDDWGAQHTEIELLAAEADVQVPYLAGK